MISAFTIRLNIKHAYKESTYENFIFETSKASSVFVLLMYKSFYVHVKSFSYVLITPISLSLSLESNF